MSIVSDQSSSVISLPMYHDVSQFLYREAELLDDWKFRDWLELLSEDISYTMRTTVNAQTRDRRRDIAPPTTWIFNDSKFQLERRVARLETGMAWAEEPPSRTRHIISNLHVLPTDKDDEIDVRLNYILYRSQKERDVTFYVGMRQDRLRKTEAAQGWQICHREITLDQAVLTSHNLSVFF